MSELALLGGHPVCPESPAAQWPVYDERERELLLAALDARGWGGFPEPAPLAGEFAQKFARAHDASFGICATNGSVTLEVAMMALGVEAGDEVIVPCYTWIATGISVVHLNAVPVFVDVDPDTYCIDPEAVKAAITPRTRGIIPVHLGSTIADMDALREIAKAHDLWIIEDCAHMHGAKWRGQGVGSMGDIGSFSFQSSKLMTSGEGGAVITSDDELDQRCHSIVNCGRKEAGYNRFDGWVLGINGRLSEFQAAILLAQLERLPELTKRRARAAQLLETQLSELGLEPLERDARITTRACYQLVMKYDKARFSGVPRDRFLAALAAEGVKCDGSFYVPIPHSPLANARTAQWPLLRERYGEGLRSPETLAKLRFPVAEKAALEEAVWMHYPYLLAEDDGLERIIEAFAKVARHATDLL